MINCKKCNGRIFIDRQYSSFMHIETYCIKCGKRKFYHPPTESAEGRWLLEKELYRAKSTITSL
jgi:predicted  nucleic acid-binding Zn-ribbon protein